MKNIIKKIINNWDPMGLIIMNNDDEYIDEIDEIEKFIQDNQNLDEKVLSDKIQKIFSEYFTKELFVEPKENIDQIASQIILQISFQNID